MTGIVLALIAMFLLGFVLFFRTIGPFINQHDGFLKAVIRAMTIIASLLLSMGSGAVLLVLVASYFIVHNIV